MITTIAVLYPQDDGTVVKKLKTTDNLVTYLPDGTARQCIDGDILSVQPDGSLQGRTVIGSWEKAKLNGVVLTYQPEGKIVLISLV